MTGFLVDEEEESLLAVERVDRLDRRLIHVRALDRFSAEKMITPREQVFQQVIDQRQPSPDYADPGPRPMRGRERMVAATALRSSAARQPASCAPCPTTASRREVPV